MVEAADSQRRRNKWLKMGRRRRCHHGDKRTTKQTNKQVKIANRHRIDILQLCCLGCRPLTCLTLSRDRWSRPSKGTQGSSWMLHTFATTAEPCFCNSIKISTGKGDYHYWLLHTWISFFAKYILFSPRPAPNPRGSRRRCLEPPCHQATRLPLGPG